MKNQLEQDFVDRVNHYCAELQKTLDACYALHYQNLQSPLVEWEELNKWIRVVKTRRHNGQIQFYNGRKDSSIHGFIAKVDVNAKNMTAQKGDIMKGATFAVPAKHARGSIYSDKGGTEAFDEMGFVHYLK